MALFLGFLVAAIAYVLYGLGRIVEKRTTTSP
jgi:hypothetical protein